MTNRPRRLLLWLLAGHLLLSLAVNAVTPIFEGPDEPNHYLYLRYLQVFHRLPVQGLTKDAVRAHHPPGYFALGALLTAGLPAPASADFADLGLRPNPRYVFRFDDPEPINKSVFLHRTVDEAWPYRGLALTVHVARLLSLAFSLAAVALTYAAARQLRPADDALALLAAGLIALNPMVVFMSGVVQNDAAALAAGAALVVVMGALLRRPPTLKLWLLAGVALGLGILLKAGLLVMAAPLGAVALYQAWRAPHGRWRGLAQATVGVGGPVAVLAGWWFVRNLQLYGDLTANSSIVALWGPLTTAERLAFLPLAAYTLTTGLLGRFGNGGIIEFSRLTYGVAGLLALAALVGWFLKLRARRTTGAGGLWAAHVLVLAVVGASVVTFALRFNGGATGKYLFPAFPSLALLLAGGALAWFERPALARWRGWAAGALLLLSGAAMVYALFGLLLPAYGPPRQPWPGEAARATPLQADLGGAAQVVGYRLSAAEVRPGGVLRVTVYWQPLDFTPGPYTVFVHLAAPDVGVIAQQDIYPGGGTYLTDAWVLGRPFVDTYYLHLPPDAPAATAELRLGLYNEATGERLPVSGADAVPAQGWVSFGQVTVTP